MKKNTLIENIIEYQDNAFKKFGTFPNEIRIRGLGRYNPQEVSQLYEKIISFRNGKKFIFGMELIIK